MIKIKVTSMRILNILILFSIFVLFNSCEKDGINIGDDPQLKKSSGLSYSSSYSAPEAFPCGDLMQVKLLAGQTKDAGTVTVSNDEDYVYVTYETKNGYYINNAHLYVGSLQNAPINNGGNPVLGSFPVIISGVPAQTTLITITFSAADLDADFIVAAKAEVYKLTNGQMTDKDGAWAEGTDFNPKGNWATYFEYEKQECVFEYQDDCFIEEKEYYIYIDFKDQAGKLKVINDNENVTITITSSGKYVMKNTYLFAGKLVKLPIGSNGYPAYTNFPYYSTSNNYILTYTYTVPLKKVPPCFVIAACAEFYTYDRKTKTYSTVPQLGWSEGVYVQNTPPWTYTEYCRQCIK